MAKDDYNVLVFKILTYLYGVFKRKHNFDVVVFKKAIIPSGISEGYLTDILRMMTNDGLIEGLDFLKVWGKEYILLNEYDEMYITSHGIQYLTENDLMKKIKDIALSNTDIIAELIKHVF